MFQSVMLADPSHAEEQVLNGSFTVVVDVGNTTDGQILAMLKPGGPALPLPVISACVEQALTVGRKVLVAR
jgi:exosome complex RNA-binding protein Rrp42 (RNase PH superfamily)